ncbi:hypothetical protein, partial [Rhizobium laguerreae]|uniref:hypothetical protein n=1 Tax=Rhizobium laguerreae TaxID=1076926 RepID=UPI0019817B57
TERHCPTIQIVSVVKKVSKLVQAVLDQLHAAAPKRELVQLSRDDALLPHCSKDDQGVLLVLPAVEGQSREACRWPPNA